MDLFFYLNYTPEYHIKKDYNNIDITDNARM